MTETERREVLRSTVKTVVRKFADPKLNGVDFEHLAAERESAIVSTGNPEEFEKRMNDLLQLLGTSHIGFFHGERPRSPGRIAIAATFTKVDSRDGVRWVFQDVHPGGVAAGAGLAPGDVLLSVDGKEIAPPDNAMFSLGGEHVVTVRKSDGDTAKSTLTIPASKDKKRPLVVPDAVVTASRPAPGTGMVRVSMFPGMLGMDVARDISRAIRELDTDRLIIDLRGNTGGGIGCLRLMSILCADKRGAGYSVDRKMLERGFDKHRLPRFDHIPSSKLGVVPLIVRFAFAGRSVAVFTEGLGTRKHHGRVVILVNEHSASASEMVAAFAKEYGLATLVGTKTPGRLVAASSFTVGHGYRVALPVAAYRTWRDQVLEGRGVDVDIEEPFSHAALLEGRDNQIEKALALLG